VRDTDECMTVTVESDVRSAEAKREGRFSKWVDVSTAAAHTPIALMLGLVVVYTFAAWLFLRSFYLADPDIWWHLATGRWILAHHALPVTDPFSSYGAGKPWIVYSWLFDIVMQLLFRSLSYMTAVLFEVVVRVALAVALFHLVRGLLPRFWSAAAVTLLALYGMSYVIGPRPGMLTILFSIIELDILLAVRRTGASKKLWLIPLLMLVWVNWHIQFVYGLMLFGVFAAEPLLSKWWWASRRSESEEWPAKKGWLALGITCLATFVNPYGPRIYSPVFVYMHQPKSFFQIVELRAMTFREPQNYAVLLVFLAAAIAVGWRRERRLLWPMLLAIASVLAFHSVKDCWFLAVVSAAALGDGWHWEASLQVRPLPTRHRMGVAIWVVAALFVGFRYYGVSNDFLEIQVDGNFPAPAAWYIEQHHLQGPLYNDFNWGGFLIWRLPGVPVAIDGRTNVHGDERVGHFGDMWLGKAIWASDPELSRANIVVANKDKGLTSILRLDPRFRIVYEDVQAIVFEHR
jgi:hypothetical protein